MELRFVISINLTMEVKGLKFQGPALGNWARQGAMGRAEPKFFLRNIGCIFLKIFYKNILH